MQHLSQVKRSPAGSLFNLLLATESVRDDENFLTGRTNRRKQSLLADLHRDVVVLDFETKRSGHAAAT